MTFVELEQECVRRLDLMGNEHIAAAQRKLTVIEARACLTIILTIALDIRAGCDSTTPRPAS